MSFRIKKYEKGFVVEVQKQKWYGKKHWTHFISVAGISSIPWFHSTYEFAEMNLIDEIRRQTAKNTEL